MDEECEVRSLVDRASKSDPDAWEELFRRSHGRLFAYARRRAPSAHAAEDAVSETIVRAMERIDRFSWSGAGFDAWLFGIMRNVILESYRSDRKARRDRYLMPENNTSLDPLESLVAQDDAERLRRAFCQLSPSEQEVLELRVVAQLTSTGAAEVLGKKPGAVRMAQVRALDRLKNFMLEVDHGK